MAKTPSTTKPLVATSNPSPEIVISPTLRSGTSTAATAAERATTALPALGEALAGPVSQFWQKMTEGASLKPDEVEVRLGLSFEGGTKWAIVATAGATIDVTVKWKSSSAAAKT
jgi:Trypsin-co-occurring domain 1